MIKCGGSKIICDMIKKVLVAVDGSETSDRAVIFAGEVASNAKAELVVLTVIPPISPLLFQRGVLGEGRGVGMRPRAVEMINEYGKSTEEAHREALEKAADTIREAYPDLQITKKMGKGRVASIIMDTSKSMNADLIVMGRIGHSKIERWLLGSTSKQVAEECDKPVLIVK